MQPPAKTSTPTPANQQALEDWLLSIMAFRPETEGKPWTFYEEVDKYLGPWGEDGYPIAYGRKYCILFSTDQELDANPAGKAWIHRTLILLQVALKDFILQRYREGTLGSLTEVEFRKAAFDSHPTAYTEGGLAMVSMLSVGLTLHVAGIPWREYLPWSKNFGATWYQVVVTGGMVVPRDIAILFTLTSGPAHSGIFARAMAMDRERNATEMALGTGMFNARSAIAAGRCDNVMLLDRFRRTLTIMQMPNESLATAARMLIATIDARRAYVQERYQREIKVDPSLYEIYKLFDPRGL